MKIANYTALVVDKLGLDCARKLAEPQQVMLAQKLGWVTEKMQRLDKAGFVFHGIATAWSMTWDGRVKLGFTSLQAAMDHADAILPRSVKVSTFKSEVKVHRIASKDAPDKFGYTLSVAFNSKLEFHSNTSARAEAERLYLAVKEMYDGR